MIYTMVHGYFLDGFGCGYVQAYAYRYGDNRVIGNFASSYGDMSGNGTGANHWNFGDGYGDGRGGGSHDWR